MSVDICSPLFEAILSHDQIMLQNLIDQTDNLNVLNEHGKTPLIMASEVGDLTSVEILLEKRAAVEEQDFNGYTALMAASRGGHVNVVNALTASSAKTDTVNIAGRTALMMACSGLHTDTVYALIRAGADAGIADKKGNRARRYVTDQDSSIFDFYKARRDIKAILRDAGDHPKSVQLEKTQPSLSELLGIHCGISKSGEVIWLVTLIFLTVFFTNNFDFADRWEGIQRNPIFLLIFSVSYTLASLRLYKPAFQLLRRKAFVDDPQAAHDSTLVIDNTSQLDFIQAVVDFGLKDINSQLVNIENKHIRKLAGLTFIFPALNIVILIVTFLMSAQMSVSAGEIVTSVFFILLLLGWIFERFRRRYSLKLIHQQLDNTATDIISKIQTKPDCPENEFILYLRAFETTGEIIISTIDFEAAITRFLEPHILVVTFGVPGEYLGAARVQSTEELWQDDVTQLMKKAKLLLLLPSDRPGTVWEGEQLRNLNLLQKTIFLMPPQMPFKDGFYSAAWERARKAFADVKLQIPVHSPRGLVFQLTADGLLAKFAALQQVDQFLKHFYRNPNDDGGHGDSEEHSDGGEYRSEYGGYEEY